MSAASRPMRASGITRDAPPRPLQGLVASIRPPVVSQSISIALSLTAMAVCVSGSPRREAKEGANR